MSEEEIYFVDFKITVIPIVDANDVFSWTMERQSGGKLNHGLIDFSNDKGPKKIWFVIDSVDASWAWSDPGAFKFSLANDGTKIVPVDKTQIENVDIKKKILKVDYKNAKLGTNNGLFNESIYGVYLTRAGKEYPIDPIIRNGG